MEEEKKFETTKCVGEYKLYMDRKLGKGSFGQVYKSQQIDKKSKQLINQEIFYAAKIIPKSNITNDKYQNILQNELVEREVNNLRDLKHENIVILYDVEVTQNNIYLIFEYCPNGCLMTYLDKKKIIKEVEAIQVMKQLVNGMEYYISKNYIHRDIKPANILIAENNVFKICDFGYSKENDDDKKEEAVKKVKINDEKNKHTLQIGSPLYLAPEIWKQKKEDKKYGNYDYKVDIWSLGITFFEMLYGKTPWNGKSEYDLFENNIFKKPLKLSEEIRSEIREILIKMLEINPLSRIDIRTLKKEVDKL